MPLTSSPRLSKSSSIIVLSSDISAEGYGDIQENFMIIIAGRVAASGAAADSAGRAGGVGGCERLRVAWAVARDDGSRTWAMAITRAMAGRGNRRPRRPPGANGNNEGSGRRYGRRPVTRAIAGDAGNGR